MRSAENRARDVRTKAESLKQLEASVVFFAASEETSSSTGFGWQPALL